MNGVSQLLAEFDRTIDFRALQGVLQTVVEGVVDALEVLVDGT